MDSRNQPGKSFGGKKATGPLASSVAKKSSGQAATSVNENRRHVISEDLRGLISGEVRVDESALHQYANDASIFQMLPLGVVRPNGHDDVVAVAKYCHENNISMIPRGAGSGLAGESLGAGLIIDFSHSMTGITSVGRETVTVQPGVVLADLNRHLQKFGRMFGPDPSSRGHSTVGGSLARDAAGSHWPVAKSCGHHLQHARVVLATGECIELGATATDHSIENRSAKLSLQSKVAAALQQHRDKGGDETAMMLPAGYRHQGISLQGEIDLLPLLIGSEGTLGMITEATLRTQPIPAHRGIVLLFFSRITDAAKVSERLGRLPISACDLVDRRLLSIARESELGFRELMPPAAEAMLLIEASGDDLAEINDTLSEVVDVTQTQLTQTLPFVMTTDDDKRDFCWKLVRRIIPTLYRLKGSTRAIPYMEDILIPPRHLEQFLVMTQGLFNQAQVTTSLFAHATQGRVHLRPLIDIANEEHLRLLESLTDQLYSRVWHMGGTVGTHGGLGFSRTPYLRQQSGVNYQLLSDIKRIFDPDYLLNPGKIIQNGNQSNLDKIRKVQPVMQNQETHGSDRVDQTNGIDRQIELKALDEPGSLLDSDSIVGGLAAEDVGGISADATPSIEHRKYRVEGTGHAPEPHFETKKTELPIIQPELDWDAASLLQAARNCNGCGRCKTGGHLERMCPVFRVERSEESSPRSKANLMRAVMTGQLNPNQLASDELKAVTDTCFNCHQCRIDCPAGVDIPKIANEIRAHYWATNGLRMSERLLNRLDILYRWASLSPTTANFLNSRRWSRWLLAKVLGIAPNRKLPKFRNHTFLWWAKRRRLTASKEGSRKIVLFTDAFVNWNDPQLGRALVAVLEHNGMSVSVPQNQRISGLSLISSGAIGPARKLARANVEILAEAIREGATVVTSEPAAALAIKQEYQHILSEPDAKLVAENTFEATDFLWQLHQAGQLRTDFRPLKAVLAHHLPCHQRATVEGNPGAELLKLIPELEIVAIEKGCSGMAGLFGVQEKNYWRSLRIGHELIREIRNPVYLAGTTECSSCRMQMEQGASKPTVHPIKILARAYGLLPELEDVFERESRDRVLS